MIADHITFGYEDRVILSDFNLIVRPGDIIWIKGENGKGKSTLLKLLSKRRNLNEKQTDIEGAVMSGNVYHAPELRIAFAFQEPLLKKGFAKEYFDGAHLFWHELCLSFDLPEDFLNRPIETYSSGEIKKLEFARALSLPSNILFLDEPLNYMDIYFRKQLEKAILKYKPTMIFVEHDEWFGKSIANRIIEL